MKHIVILTGAGMSAESGISTFRDSGGLWEKYPVEQVASIEGWYRDPKLVLEFYNQRRAQLADVKPNRGHEIVAELEKDYKVTVITQNVDDLHERAGSTNVIHLHGELTKACNERKTQVMENGTRRIEWGEKADDGTQLRPFIVWFGEAVPLMETAARIVTEADIVVIIGTSMKVSPAASLMHYAPKGTPIYLIDPNPASVPGNVEVITEGASKGMEKLKDMLAMARG